MKTTLLFLSVFLSVSLFGQYTQIPDSNFEQALIDLGHDDVIDGQVLTANVNTLLVLGVVMQNINDLTGISDFSALTMLYCGDNYLTSLDVSQNTALTNLNCGHNYLTSLDISQNTALIDLWCGFNELTSLDLNHNTNIKNLN